MSDETGQLTIREAQRVQPWTVPYAEGLEQARKTLKEGVVEAVKAGADLGGADLRDADLGGAASRLTAP